MSINKITHSKIFFFCNKHFAKVIITKSIIKITTTKTKTKKKLKTKQKVNEKKIDVKSKLIVLTLSFRTFSFLLMF